MSEADAFVAWLVPFRKIEWVVIVPKARLRHDAKPPFGAPEAVLAHLSRYTHRVALQWTNYRVKNGDRRSVIRLSTSEFIRRILIHVLPDRFHRIRRYGPLVSWPRKANIAKVRILLGAPVHRQDDPPVTEIIPLTLSETCPDCGGQMRIIETFRRGQKPQSRAPPRKAAA